MSKIVKEKDNMMANRAKVSFMVMLSLFQSRGAIAVKNAREVLQEVNASPCICSTLLRWFYHMV